MELIIGEYRAPVDDSKRCWILKTTQTAQNADSSYMDKTLNAAVFLFPAGADYIETHKSSSYIQKGKKVVPITIQQISEKDGIVAYQICTQSTEEVYDRVNAVVGQFMRTRLSDNPLEPINLQVVYQRDGSVDVKPIDIEEKVEVFGEDELERPSSVKKVEFAEVKASAASPEPIAKPEVSAIPLSTETDASIQVFTAQLSSVDKEAEWTPYPDFVSGTPLLLKKGDHCLIVRSRNATNVIRFQESSIQQDSVAKHGPTEYQMRLHCADFKVEIRICLSRVTKLTEYDVRMAKKEILYITQ